MHHEVYSISMLLNRSPQLNSKGIKKVLCTILRDYLNEREVN